MDFNENISVETTEDASVACSGVISAFPDVLTVDEVAAILRCSKSVAYRLIRAKEISSFMIGCTYRILKTDLIRYMNNAAA